MNAVGTGSIWVEEGNCLLSLWLHRSSKYLGTREPEARLLFAECPAQSPRIDSRVFALNLKNRLGETSVWQGGGSCAGIFA